MNAARASWAQRHARTRLRPPQRQREVFTVARARGVEPKQVAWYDEISQEWLDWWFGKSS